MSAASTLILFFALVEEKRCRWGRGGLLHSRGRSEFLNGFQEAAKFDGLEQIVYYIELVALQRVLVVSRSDDHLRRIGERAQKIEALQFG